jgi:hypothetical protein
MINVFTGMQDTHKRYRIQFGSKLSGREGDGRMHILPLNQS